PPVVVPPPSPPAAVSAIPFPVRVERTGGHVHLTVDLSGHAEVRAVRVAGAVRTVTAGNPRLQFVVGSDQRVAVVEAAGADGRFVRVSTVRLTGEPPGREPAPSDHSAGEPGAGSPHSTSTAAVTAP